MINITNGMTYLRNLSAETRLLHIKQYPMASLDITIYYTVQEALLSSQSQAKNKTLSAAYANISGSV